MISHQCIGDVLCVTMIYTAYIICRDGGRWKRKMGGRGQKGNVVKIYKNIKQKKDKKSTGKFVPKVFRIL